MGNGILHALNPFSRIGPPVIEGRNDFAFEQFVKGLGFHLVLI
jgi:hypothetical protein